MKLGWGEGSSFTLTAVGAVNVKLAGGGAASFTFTGAGPRPQAADISVTCVSRKLLPDGSRKPESMP